MSTLVRRAGSALDREELGVVLATAQSRLAEADRSVFRPQIHSPYEVGRYEQRPIEFCAGLLDARRCIDGVAEINDFALVVAALAGNDRAAVETYPKLGNHSEFPVRRVRPWDSILSQMAK